MQENTHTLANFLNSVSQVINKTYEGYYWISAELAAAHKKSKGYWVFELQESDTSGKKLAQTQALLWANNANRVIYKFERESGQKLASGMQVRLLVEASFHPQWGFRLTIQDIDSSFTLGQAELNNQKIREKLISLKIWDLNKKLPSPNEFCNIAIIAPDTSAGLEDFMREANILSENNLAYFDLFISPFEGNNTSKGITSAFDNIVKSNKNYDCICIVRGGGASSGIAWLNQEEIIKKAATCPIPIISGIGHERDITLIDEVANISLGTPSKTIGFITSTIINNALNALRDWELIQTSVEQRLSIANNDLDENMLTVKMLTNNLLDSANTKIDNDYLQVINLSPNKTLERGYASIKTKEKIIKTKKEAVTKKDLIVMFNDGEMKVKPAD